MTKASSISCTPRSHAPPPHIGKSSFMPGSAIPLTIRDQAPPPETPLLAEIVALDHEGRGVARVDGKVIFIDGGLPGETVEYRRARRKSNFDPATFRDRYQDALQELVEGKLKGVVRPTHEVAEPPKVINLMYALKRSLSQESGAEMTETVTAARTGRGKTAQERRQAALLLPVSGGRKRREAAIEKPAASTPGRSRKKA